MSERRGPDYIPAAEATRIRGRRRTKRALTALAATLSVSAVSAGFALAPSLKLASEAAQIADSLEANTWIQAKATLWAPGGDEVLAWSETVKNTERHVTLGKTHLALTQEGNFYWDDLAQQPLRYNQETLLRTPLRKRVAEALREWSSRPLSLRKRSDGTLSGPIGTDELRLRKADQGYDFEILRSWAGLPVPHLRGQFALDIEEPKLPFNPDQSALAETLRKRIAFFVDRRGTVYVRCPDYPGPTRLTDQLGRAYRGINASPITGTRQTIAFPLDARPTPFPLSLKFEYLANHRGAEENISAVVKQATCDLFPGDFFTASFGDLALWKSEFDRVDTQGRAFALITRDPQGKVAPDVEDGEPSRADRELAAAAFLRAAALYHELGPATSRDRLWLHWDLAKTLLFLGRDSEARGPLMIVRDLMPGSPLSPAEQLEIQQALLTLNEE